MFSLAGIISGDSKDGECPGPSQDLFKKIEKEDFQHNYANIPDRKRNAVDLSDDDEEVTKLTKTQKANRRKKLKKEEQRKKPTKKLILETGEGEEVELKAIVARKGPALPKKPNNNPREKDPEKESRTVFVGNLPLTTVEKTLKNMFSEYGKIETIRFRSIPRAELGMSKKGAFCSKKFHKERGSFNAYVRFSTKEEAMKSQKLNGTKVEEHVIRVDMAQNKEFEKNQTVFVGNLAFNVQDNDVYSAFKECGDIEGVRLVRCPNTGIGKGIGYVSFSFKESVETALSMDGTVTINDRPIRVSKCVKKLKKKEENPRLKKKGKPRTEKDKRREAQFIKKYYTQGDTKPDKFKDKFKQEIKPNKKFNGVKPPMNAHELKLKQRNVEMKKYVKTEKKLKREAKSFQGDSTLEKDIRIPKSVKPLNKSSNEYKKKMMAEKLLNC